MDRLFIVTSKDFDTLDTAAIGPLPNELFAERVLTFMQELDPQGGWDIQELVPWPHVPFNVPNKGL